MKKWTKLTEANQSLLRRGSLLKFPASYPFESEVVMMMCGHPDEGRRLFSIALITITGYCSGINPYVVFPSEALSGETGVSKEWLISNWKKWVWPDGNVEDVWIRKELSATEL